MSDRGTWPWVAWLIAVVMALVALRALEAWEHTTCMRTGGHVIEGCASDRCDK